MGAETWVAKTRRAAPALLLLALAAARPARATLGADVTSVARDREALQGSLAVTSAAAWQVHELSTPSGVVVREYVAKAGQVFAVTWEGKRQPDLRQLLGPWFARFTSETRAHRTGHHLLSIDAPDFSVSVVRFQRGFRGRAILPAQLPAGVSRDQLR
jgi:Protein of unknown function (DUF2844)